MGILFLIIYIMRCQCGVMSRLKKNALTSFLLLIAFVACPNAHSPSRELPIYQTLGKSGLPVWSAPAMEYRKKKCFTQKPKWIEMKIHPPLHLADANCSDHAAVLYKERPYWIAGVSPRQALALRPR